MRKSIICIFASLFIVMSSSCSPSRPVRTYHSLEELKTKEEIEFLDINNPMAFFENKTISRLSSEDNLDITVMPNEDSVCSINFESQDFHIQVIKYSHLIDSISSKRSDYSNKIINNIKLEYYFEDSNDKNLIFGFEYQDCYYKFIIVQYKTILEQDLLDILYQYIASLSC